MAVFGLILRALLLIVAISAAFSAAPQQKQTTQITQKQQTVERKGVARVQDPKCLQPMEMGPCRMNLARFYYNSQSNTCEPFQFGGCRGNDNKFGFLKTCEDACVVPKKTTTNNVVNSKTPATGNVAKTAANAPTSTTTTTKAPNAAQTQPKATKPIK